MGMKFSVNLGPFADWLVPAEDHPSGRAAWRPLLLSLTDGYGPYLERRGDNREIVIDGREYVRDCWLAYFLDDGDRFRPPRRLYWDEHQSDADGVWEYGGFDIESEKRWFRESFADELARLAAAYGSEPNIRWGLVTKHS